MRSLLPKTILKRVIDRYLDSGDFNGLYIAKASKQYLAGTPELVRAGLVQIMGDEDYLNVHIRPWPSRRPAEAQIASLEAVFATDRYGVCLYPTPAAMEGRVPLDLFQNQPYRRRLAEGRGSLECAFFRFDVLETYRNDPKYLFQFNDFGVSFGISDEAYFDPAEPESDKTGILHTGFAYEFEESGTVHRRVCAFLTDLAKLSPEHQQRWRTYEVAETSGVSPHPVWFSQQMGHWPDGFGPFEHFMWEIQTWNELHQRAYGMPLMRHTDRPREFGWVLRGSQHEFDAFLVQLDKLLSDNLKHDALDATGIPDKDQAENKIGTLNRLDLLLERNGIPDSARTPVLKPLRAVRAARQKPAHVIRANITDANVVQRQIDLMSELTRAVALLRTHWQGHPANADWAAPDYIENAKHYRM